MMFNIKTKTADYMSIVVTHECNKKCAFCVDQYRGRNEYITLKSVYNALDIAKLDNIKDILLVGGEPTLHPKIVEIARIVKSYGFNTILTTNYKKPEVMKALDMYVDSFNISYYNQKELPKQKNFKADLTLSALITKQQLSTQNELDSFIDTYKNDLNLKFSTLTICNDYTAKNQQVDYLDDIAEKKSSSLMKLKVIFIEDTLLKDMIE